MSRHVLLTSEAYELLVQQKREGYPIKRLASEPIIEKYKPLLRAAEAAARPVASQNSQNGAAGAEMPYNRLPTIQEAVKYARKNGKPEAAVHAWWEFNEKKDWKIKPYAWRKAFMSFAKMWEEEQEAASQECNP